MKKSGVSTLKVRDVMTREVFTVTGHMTLREIMNLLITKNMSGAPVVGGIKQKIISVVSEADVIRFAAMSDLDTQLITFINKLPAANNVQTVLADEPFAKVYEKFLKFPFRRIPIVDEDGNLVGVVSRRDIMRAFLANDKPDKKEKAAA